MGNSYVNHTVRGATPEAVAKLLKGRTAVIAATENDCVVVFDSECDTEDQSLITELGEKLSSELNASVLAVLNHDDDMLWYQLFENGKVTDEYDSMPGYFDEDSDHSGALGGDAKKLSTAFAVKDEVGIARILKSDKYAAAVERHAALCEALNLPEFAAGCGYRDIDSGELPDGLDETDLVKIG
ncbi:MAG: hypothetical protein JWO95_2777 [Verrucomicrobiales bacterium]|nr:hypothetical protein [Verrucomicrobiales bacterium]